MTRKSVSRLAVAILAVVAMAAGYMAMAYKKSERADTYNTAAIARGSIESIVTAQGKLEPKNYVDVGAEVSGQIKKLYVDYGTVVKAGDLLAEIDPTTFEATVKGDEARIKQLEAQIRQQDASVAQAKQKAQRYKDLYNNKAAALETYQDAQTALKVARDQSLSLEAQLEEAQSTLDGDQADLERTRIFSPIDGTVVSLSVKEGQTINANQTAPVIGEVAKLDVMTVRAQVAEADITKLSTGMPVYFTTLGNQDRKWHGTVRQILPSPETVNDVVLYDVLSDVDNTDGQLMTGMTTQTFFVLGSAKDVPTIPAAALLERKPDADTKDGRAYEVKVLEGGKPVPRTIIVGLNDRSTAQVVSGLKEGDRIVLPSTVAPSGSGTGGGPGRMPRL
ncbi:MAG: efflux RND transporter periplasmic adaptor subunit [Alphaproteobacteria bacterium]|nr:efflux RND transporter periplasmic adaptor subunit [Alphaproteobacteria bacterium]USO07438.1 MAG: efflux RND transporter periplasmic adaptor subunit [Rhodospirillales bacterium]